MYENNDPILNNNDPIDNAEKAVQAETHAANTTGFVLVNDPAAGQSQNTGSQVQAQQNFEQTGQPQNTASQAQAQQIDWQ